MYSCLKGRVNTCWFVAEELCDAILVVSSTFDLAMGRDDCGQVGPDELRVDSCPQDSLLKGYTSKLS